MSRPDVEGLKEKLGDLVDTWDEYMDNATRARSQVVSAEAAARDIMQDIEAACIEIAKTLATETPEYIQPTTESSAS